MSETKWLRCAVDKGMFSDEVAVTYPAIGAYQKSVFVQKRDVDGVGAVARVRVVVIRRNGTTYATLPTEDRDVVTVSPADLSEHGS